MEFITKSLPINLPNITSREELQQLVTQKEAELEELHNSLRVLVWCTDFNAIKPAEMQTIQWLNNNVDYLFGKEDTISKTVVQLYQLQLWLKNWDNTVVVDGFKMESSDTEAAQPAQC